MALLGKQDWSVVEAVVSDWREYQPSLERRFRTVLGDAPLTFLPFPEAWKSVLGNFHR